jgi:hypothetical protein
VRPDAVARARDFKANGPSASYHPPVVGGERHPALEAVCAQLLDLLRASARTRAAASGRPIQGRGCRPRVGSDLSSRAGAVVRPARDDVQGWTGGVFITAHPWSQATSAVPRYRPLAARSRAGPSDCNDFQTVSSAAGSDGPQPLRCRRIDGVRWASNGPVQPGPACARWLLRTGTVVDSTDNHRRLNFQSLGQSADDAQRG